ncbi:MAG TPA: hypothetical protein VFK02_25645, partial [Kofleriaceae bacterium]|nr:hypothetical protein [Kofleriaceae bacterium]
MRDARPALHAMRTRSRMAMRFPSASIYDGNHCDFGEQLDRFGRQFSRGRAGGERVGVGRLRGRRLHAVGRVQL